MGERIYPIRPQLDDDPRFTTGLVIDVFEVLERHGYPKPGRGGDYVELRQALFRFLYGSADDGGAAGGEGRG